MADIAAKSGNIMQQFLFQAQKKTPPFFKKAASKKLLFFKTVI
ncbi:hypothetical protein [Komagataeibacter xylinus]|nr:hypothetical protein [Komagataeibacter xylinus]